MQQTAEQERLQREVVRASRQAFDIAETRLRAGTVDLVTVLQTQQTLFQAQDNLAQVRLARARWRWSALFQALGGGWLKPKETARRQHRAGGSADALIRAWIPHEIYVMCCESPGCAAIYDRALIPAQVPS